MRTRPEPPEFPPVPAPSTPPPPLIHRLMSSTDVPTPEESPFRV